MDYVTVIPTSSNQNAAVTSDTAARCRGRVGNRAYYDFRKLALMNLPYNLEGRRTAFRPLVGNSYHSQYPDVVASGAEFPAAGGSGVRDVLYAYTPASGATDDGGAAAAVGTMFQDIRCPTGIRALTTAGGGYAGSGAAGMTTYACAPAAGTTAAPMRSTVAAPATIGADGTMMTVDCGGRPLTALTVLPANAAGDPPRAVYACATGAAGTDREERTAVLPVMFSPAFASQLNAYRAYAGTPSAAANYPAACWVDDFLHDPAVAGKDPATLVCPPGKVLTSVRLAAPAAVQYDGAASAVVAGRDGRGGAAPFVTTTATYACVTPPAATGADGPKMMGWLEDPPAFTASAPSVVRGIRYTPLYAIAGAGYKSPTSYVDNTVLRTPLASSAAAAVQPAQEMQTVVSRAPFATTTSSAWALECPAGFTDLSVDRGSRTVTYRCATGVPPLRTGRTTATVDANSTWIFDPNTYLTLLGQVDCGTGKALTGLRATAGPAGPRLEYDCAAVPT